MDSEAVAQHAPGAGAVRDTPCKGADKPWPPEVWTVGTRCDAMDTYSSWLLGKVVEMDAGRVKVHYLGALTRCTFAA